MATEKKSELVSSPATVADAAVTSKLPEMNPLNEAEQIPPVNGATTNQQQVPLASLQKKKARTVKNKTAPNGHPMTEGRGQLAGKQSKKSTVKPAESTASEKLASQNPALKKQPKKVSGEIKATKSAKKSRKEVPAQEVVKIILQLRFHTIPGQRLFITGNHELFGNNDIERALPMEFFNQEAWRAEMLLDPLQLPDQAIAYNYVLKNADGTLSYDWGSDKRLQLKNQKSGELLIIDSWNHAGFYENVFYTEPFTNVLLKENFTTVKATAPKTVTHIFKVKAPLLKKNQAVAISGNCKAFGDWNPASAAVMSRTAGEDFWFLKVNLSRAVFPLVYKYCVYDVSEEKLIRYEDGNNRVLYDTAQKNRQTILNDGFVILPNNTWKGAGVAIPVFSLRSRNSFGAGEFHDLKLLVDWAKKTGLRLIQILPVNDTTATNTWLDSYPYAAISAFALHPMYLNLDGMVSKENQHLLEESSAERNRLNQLPEIDYTAVNHLKWKIIRRSTPARKRKCLHQRHTRNFLKTTSTG